MDKRNIKNLLREMPFLRWVLTYHKQREDKYLAHLRAPYIPLLEKWLDSDTSIISSNCFAGRVMQDWTCNIIHPHWDCISCIQTI